MHKNISAVKVRKKKKKKEHLKMRAARAWFQALNFGFADAIDDC